jgi:hypothetical protein
MCVLREDMKFLTGVPEGFREDAVLGVIREDNIKM